MPRIAGERHGPGQENPEKLESQPGPARPAKGPKAGKAPDAGKAGKAEKAEKIPLYLTNLPTALIKFGGLQKQKITNILPMTEKPPKREVSVEEEPCALGPIVIPCCQVFNNIHCYMVFYCVLVLSQGILFSLVDLNIANFQKDYNLKLIENFALAFSYDISSGLVAIFVAFYGEGNKKIKWIVVSSFLIGFGSLLFAYPFINSRYNQQKVEIEGIADASSTLGYALGYVIGAPLVQVSENNTSEIKTGQLGNLTAPCNEQCRCSSSIHNSICGRDDIEYFSPCFAGCTYSKMLNKQRMYYNCSCIKEGLITADGEGEFIDARRGKCDAKCYKLPLFIAFISSVIIFSGFSGVPLTVAIIRILPDKLRSLALGVNYVIVRIFGSIPGPLAFKFSGENSCTFRDINTCGRTGHCWIYNKTRMAYLLVGICSVCKILTITFTSIAFVIFNRFLKKDSHMSPTPVKKMKAKRKNKEKK
uniref:Solute carrier organic anion transporter family member 6A1 n=1 Tax=Prolemur simus TaxID=1328070 RepID=A0A8C8ZMF7_PROSS